VPGGRALETGCRIFRDRGLFDGNHLSLHLSEFGAVCLSPPTKNAAGQKMTMAAAVATPSLVR